VEQNADSGFAIVFKIYLSDKYTNERMPPRDIFMPNSDGSKEFQIRNR
jgi:hypothetical protein